MKFPSIRQELLFDRKTVPHLIIENPALYRDIAKQMVEQSEGIDEYFVYECNGKKGDFSKDAFLVLSPFLQLLDDKKEAALIQKQLAVSAKQDQKDRYYSILGEISNFVRDLSLDYPVPVSVDFELGLSAFLKAVGVQPIRTNEAFLNEFIDSIKQMSVTQRKSLFVIFEARSFLESSEIETLFMESLSLDCDLLLVSSHLSPSQLRYETRILVDHDLCEY